MAQPALSGKVPVKPRTAQILAVVTVYLLAFGAIVLLICMVVPELIRNLQLFAASVNQYLLEAQAMLNGFTETFGLPPVDLSDFINTVSQYLGTLSSFINEMIPQIVEVTGGFISGVVTAFISIILSVYLLSGKDRLLMQLRRTFKVYLPNRAHAFFGRLYRIVAQVFGDYVAGQCKEAVILGVLCFIGMSLLRLDYAALISTVIAVTALIPMLGAYIGGAVGVGEKPVAQIAIKPQKPAALRFRRQSVQNGAAQLQYIGTGYAATGVVFLQRLGKSGSPGQRPEGLLGQGGFGSVGVVKQFQQGLPLGEDRCGHG